MKTKTITILATILLSLNLNANIYKIQTTSPDQIIAGGEYVLELGDTNERVAALYDDKGLINGVGSDVHLSYHAGKNTAGTMAGILFDGRYTSTLHNIGDIAATVDISSTGGQINGLELYDANQAAGALVSSNISVTGVTAFGVRMERSSLGDFTSDFRLQVTGLGGSSAYGIAIGSYSSINSFGGTIDLKNASGTMTAGINMSSNSHIKEITSTADISVSSPGENIGILMMGGNTATIDSIAGAIRTESESASYGILNLNSNLGDILETALIEVKAGKDVGGYGKTSGINTSNDIGTIYGKIYVETNNDTSLAAGVRYTSTGTHTLTLGGNSEISGVNLGSGRSNSVYAEQGDLIIKGDYAGQQKLIGDMYAANGLKFEGANVFIDNSESITKINSGSGTLSVDQNSTLEFAKATEISSTSFDVNGTIVLDARTLDDHASINLIGGTNANIGEDASLMVFLGDNFTAVSGDKMTVFSSEDGTIWGSFTQDITVQFEGGKMLTEGLDYTFDGQVVTFISTVVIPEASEIAALIGLIALGFAARRRGKR